MRTFILLCFLSLGVCAPLSAQLAEAAPATPASFGSLCTPEESVIFSCPLENKELVSVCLSKEYGPDKGYMQLRKGPAGPAGKAGKANLTLPAQKTAPSKAAKGGAWMFAGGGGAYVQFGDGDTAYTVYAATGKWGEKGETVSKDGLATQKSGKRTDLRCTAAYDGDFGPSFIDAAGIPALEPEFELPD